MMQFLIYVHVVSAFFMKSHAVGSIGSSTADIGIHSTDIRRKDTTDDSIAPDCTDALMVEKHLLSRGFSGFEGGTDQIEFENEVKLARDVHARAICQTGFNTGTSALAFLCADVSTRVFSFDINSHEYVQVSSNYLASLFGQERLRNFWGDSKVTLSNAIKAGGVEPGVQCDLAFVDGGHSFELALNDITLFRNLTKPNSRLIVENCNVNGKACGYGGIAAVNKAYQEAVKRGIVAHEKQISTQCSQCDSKCRELCVGRYT